MSAIRSSLWAAVAAVVGVIPAVLVFRYVFSDPSGTLSALTVRLLLTGALYFVFGAAFGYFQPRRSWHWGLEVGVPAMIIFGFPAMMALRNGVTAGFIASAGTLAVALVAGCLGAWLAARA
ncbi:MAG: hypothetical protein ACRELV_00155, partial [Longimicrobiales bacterium]